jgi:GMP synthase (glutamine-hydrolysing)
VPFLGICYGHQLLGRAAGGEVGYHPRGREAARSARFRSR